MGSVGSRAELGNLGPLKRHTQEYQECNIIIYIFYQDMAAGTTLNTSLLSFKTGRQRLQTEI